MELGQLLRLRSQLNQVVRSYFVQNGYLEMETPLLVTAPGCEVHLDYFGSQWRSPQNKLHNLFLRSSPELHMKQILATGEPRIFQLARSFRNNGELADWHHPEFTMLEWYTLHQTFQEMIDQTVDFVRHCCDAMQAPRLPPAKLITLTVAEAFEHFCGLELLDQDADLAKKAIAAGVGSCRPDDDFETAFFKTLLEKIEPALAKNEWVALIDYPASQAALAKIEGGVAKRVEIYWQGIELCNGFDEVTSGQENKARFEQVIKLRQGQNLAQHPVDQAYLAAIGDGLPPCCGNALGVDRLLALMLGLKGIGEIIPFRRQWSGLP